MSVISACLPSPQAIQSLQLFDRLAGARSDVLAGTPAGQEAGCEAVGDTQTRLVGEPGLTTIRAWASLSRAAQALAAVCGLHALLAYPSREPPAARDAWQARMQRETSVACDHLRDAADALERPRPC